MFWEVPFSAFLSLLREPVFLHETFDFQEYFLFLVLWTFSEHPSLLAL